jgi:hypothetical protein
MEEIRFNCTDCEREFKTYQALNSHKWRSHTEMGKSHKPVKINRIPWNKGLTKDSDERVKKSGNTFSENLKEGKRKNHWVGKKHKKESLDKISKNGGGYRKGSGRGKSGWYKGYWCDSTWELAWVIYNLDHGIKFERNKEGFEYEYLGKKFKYYPDFIIEDSYLEIKGHMDKKNLEKIKQFPHKLIIISAKEIDIFIDYAKEKYKVDYLPLLYEDGEKYKKVNVPAKIREEKRLEQIEKIKDSGIDFRKRGWINQAAKISGISRNRIREWIKNNIPELEIE